MRLSVIHRSNVFGLTSIAFAAVLDMKPLRGSASRGVSFGTIPLGQAYGPARDDLIRVETS